jgi:hypothetical protein
VHPKSEKAKGSGREPENTCAKQGQKSDLQARFTKKVALVEVNPESEFAAQDRGTDSGLWLIAMSAYRAICVEGSLAHTFSISLLA